MCATENKEPDIALAECLGSETSPDHFWQTVKTNLQAGKIRLVFVADDIPVELRRVVEFLNRQMNPAEVLAVEVRQYVGKGLKTFVPRVYGQISEKDSSGGGAGVGPVRQWDEQSFLAKMAKRGDGEVKAAMVILEWARERGCRFGWGKGKSNDASCYLMFDYRGINHYLFSFRTGYRNPYISLHFSDMKIRPPFDETARREEFRQRLNSVGRINVPADSLDRYPSIYFSAIPSEESLRSFLEVIDWVIAEIKGS